ncbi:MAG TPA: ABC transporter substrate-binding protein, partial [Chloroflexota bacterium]|nr:ABC transporter substrate-binding protein [Chloroflexota bacterium]
LWQSNFNPFSPAVNWYSIGALYETLMYINTLNGKATPMLATGYQWSNGNKTLTFTTRQGVQWSDGQAFSAADVAFTFNLMKKFSGLDFQSIWSVLKSVQAQGANKVVMTFQQPAVPFFYFIAGKQPIVAQHIWSSIKNPVTYADAQPVVTGPFTVQQVSPQTITFVRNPHYWQPGKPYLDKVLYPAFTSNPPANLYLAEGKAQWGGQFIPNIQAYYVSRDPANNHYWFPPNENVNLYINTTAYPLSVTAVRQALAYAIDRQRVSTIGEYGYEPPANQTGVVLPTFASWYDKSLADKYNYTFNPQKAISILKAAGFTRSGSGPFMTPKGKPLSFSVINVGGNTDWVASLEVVRSDLQQVGIGLTVENLSQNDYQSRIYNGQFDLAYDTDTVGPNPYYTYQNVLFSGNSAPIGKAASSNYERWMSPQTDALLKQFAGTTDSARQHAIVNQLQQIMLQDVPVIPVTEGVSWYQWSTKQFAGWPTQQNPYANPAPYNTPDWEQVLLNVHLK